MSSTETEILKHAYNAGAMDEYQRLASSEGKVEFSKVCSAIEQYTTPGSVIYDIGCGPGRYTEYLVNKGYSVGCVDLSEKSLALFDERLQEAKTNKILFSKSCCASELDWIAPESANTILLLGPMYHITKEAKRKLVIEHCYRILKKSGYVISMFMSPYAALIPQLSAKNNLLEVIEKENYMVTKTSFKGFKVPQYRCWPQDAITEFQNLFVETDIIHVDEIQPCRKFDISNKNKEKHSENYSHQYFVIYRKK